MSDLYNEIGKLLASVSPKEAKITVLNAEISEDGAVGTFKYKYFDEFNQVEYFAAGGIANEKMLEILSSLRGKFLSEKNEFWSSCEFKLNLESGNFEMDFKYPN